METKRQRKTIEITCPDCNQTRQSRTDIKRKSNRCMKCSILNTRMNCGDILHGLRTHPLYIRWSGMKRRCKDLVKRKSYMDKGVVVCNEWANNFVTFFEWSLKNGFEEGLELDRINNNGNYCPENCRWITHQQNCMNKN